MAILIACLWTFLQMLDAGQLVGSVGANPSLTFRPKPPEGHGSLIRYTAVDPTSYQYWINDLSTISEPYKYDAEHPEAFQNVQNCDFNNPPASGKVCDVDTRAWGPCTKENKFGYQKSMPCVFLELNNLTGWTPEFYDNPDALPSEMPDDLKEHIKNVAAGNKDYLNMTWVSCEGELPVDNEYMGPIKYYPTRGFPGYYFPYTGQEGYRNPVVAVHLQRPAIGLLIRVVCRAWARNIQYDRDLALGSTMFEIMVE